MAVDLQVIGVGLGRTGTNSLKLALEQLGFGPCYHMSEVFQHPERARRWQDRAAGELVPWEELLQGYRAAVDWPPVYFWRELVRDFPQAKVILSTRDAGRWYASLDATIHQALKASPPPDMPEPVRAQRLMAADIIMERHFDNRFSDREHALAVFAAHQAEVERTVAPQRLLTWCADQGWDGLCRFLGVPVPQEPFPHTNRKEEFFKMHAREDR